jgi:hypothetical protein
MQRLSGTVLSILRFLGLAFAQGSYSRPGSIRGDVFTKGTNGEPAVLPSAQIVFHWPITKETELDAKGAFAIDGLPPGTYQFEANAPGLYAAVAVKSVPAIQRKGRSVLSVWDQGWEFANKICERLNSFEDETEIFLTDDDRKWLKAIDGAFSRKVHHA